MLSPCTLRARELGKYVDDLTHTLFRLCLFAHVLSMNNSLWTYHIRQLSLWSEQNHSKLQVENNSLWECSSITSFLLRFLCLKDSNYTCTGYDVL